VVKYVKNLRKLFHSLIALTFFHLIFRVDSISNKSCQYLFDKPFFFIHFGLKKLISLLWGATHNTELHKTENVTYFDFRCSIYIRSKASISTEFEMPKVEIECFIFQKEVDIVYILNKFLCNSDSWSL